MRGRSIIAAVAAALLMAACQPPPTPPPPPAPTADTAAQRALTELRAMVTPRNFADLGFAAVGDVQTAQLGPPLRTFVIGLDKARRFTPAQTDARSLIEPAPEILYPVTVNGAARSAITIVPARGGYISASFGDARLIQVLSAFRSTAPGSTDALVSVPALGLYFISREVNGRLFFVPIGTEPRLQLPIGVAVPAEQVLSMVVPLAQLHNGKPG